MFLYYRLYKKPFSSHDLYTSVWRSGKKTSIPGIEVVREKRSSSLLFERMSSLSDDQSILNLSTALVTISTPHKHENEVASPQYPLYWHL